MKEIKINAEMLRDLLDKCFWDVMDLSTYFMNELSGTDLMTYIHDNCHNNNELNHLVSYGSTYFNHSDSYDYSEYVTPEVAEKVGNYYNATQDLIRTIRFYLCKYYEIDLNKELKKRKEERKQRKHRR